MPRKKIRSLRGKIARTMVVVVGLTLLCVAVLSLFSARAITSTLGEANREMSQTSRSRSSSSMTALTQTRLLELADGKAELADRMFYEFEEAVSSAAVAAAQLYADAESYPPREVAPPRMENDGKLTLQVLFATGVDPEDEEIAKEVRLLGNLQELLYAVNFNNPSIASNYIATESGIMLQADYISAMKFDKSGAIMPLDAKLRPWYQGAAETGGLFLTPVVEDLHTRRPGVMCSVPVYCGGELKAVSGAGMYLDNVEAIIRDMNLGETGEACIVNQVGQVLFSSYDGDEAALFYPGQDLSGAGDEALRTLAEKASAQESGVIQLDLNRAPCYVAYAPMTTTGWSVFVILARKEVEAPTAQLQADLDRISAEAAAEADRHVQTSMLLLLAVLVFALMAALGISLLLSRRIVTPIRTLTEEVSRIEGDDLDFHWDLETGDETELLAKSFESLTERMKSYITEIRTITAEKEHIATELALAARIQSDMLPSVFPPFPDRPEFDVYASMDPARDVGGDFYDFFFIDRDHLCLVIADVSGKGIPATLFMMISKVILQNCAMLGKSAAEILRMTNESLCASSQSDMFVTAWVGILELSTGRLTAANAGHEYPALMQNGAFSLLRDRHGFILGGMEDLNYPEYELQLEPGDKLFVYTDGVPEATDAQSAMFGTERMLDALNAEPQAAPERILENVRAAVDGFVRDAEQFDDLTMLCIEYRGG